MCVYITYGVLVLVDVSVCTILKVKALAASPLSSVPIEKASPQNNSSTITPNITQKRCLDGCVLVCPTAFTQVTVAMLWT